MVAYRHGFRASELVALRWDDIDLATGRLHVRRAKGGDASVHPISARESRALRKLLREAPTSYVFISEPAKKRTSGDRWVRVRHVPLQEPRPSGNSRR